MDNNLFYVISLAAMLMLTRSDKPHISYTETGKASYYANKFHGKNTASGEPYDKNALTAAHKTLPFGTKVNVFLTQNPKDTAVVIINDRGPHTKKRIIDLSLAAAKKIGLFRKGVATVTLEVHAGSIGTKSP